jgi:xylulose-5-phosphate/fructose-6-phosphate phosphoketolase
MPGTEEAADALWRAAVYASVCQLHLQGNVLLAGPLLAEHVKPRPSGHWGTVPGTAWALAHVALAAAACGDRAVIPLLGAGHAGVVQLAFSWLTGDLAGLRPRFTADARGLAALSAAFPDVEGLGSEVVPGLAAGDFLGGRLGGCLAFAQGAGMDAPDRIMVPVIGDGECETPATAAAWLAHAASAGAKVAPVVHLNGFRMGAPSLLAALGDQELRAWARGHGWEACIVTVGSGVRSEHAAFHRSLLDTLASADSGHPALLVMRCGKGWGGPGAVGGRAIAGTARAHKTPLTRAGTDDAQRAQLASWLASYRPGELFDSAGRPHGVLADALAVARFRRLAPAAGAPAPPVTTAGASTFAEAVEQAAGTWAGAGAFRVFSPDELESNRLGSLAAGPFASEVLAEEVLLEWLAGWTASGRRGVLVSYEAFASLLVPGLISHMKQRRLPSCPVLPSLNVLLTSYGWHNTYTHGDPSAATALLATGDPAVRVLTPADRARLAVTLHECLASAGRVNIIIAGKHGTTAFPAGAIEEEQRRGLAVWAHSSDAGEPDLTIVTAGDLPARAVAAGVRKFRGQAAARIRVVNVADLTVLGDPSAWPRGLTGTEAARYLGTSAPVLIVTLGHPAAVWGLLQGRLGGRRVDVIGWREPCSPMPQAGLAQWAGMNSDAIATAAGRLLAPAGVLP